MNVPFDSVPLRSTPLRAHKIIYFLAASSALGFGVFAALALREWLVFVGVVACIGVLALALPRAWLAPALVAFAVVQFYVPLPGTTFILRGALVFVALVALRVLATESIAWRAWMLPASAFVLVAFVAAFGATNRYVALRGIYDWLAVFVTLFVASATVFSTQTRTRAIIAMIVFGILEAVAGFAQTLLGVERVMAWLNAPGVELFFQPDLLRERVATQSFNWLVFDRVLPFGNFINAIDYAVLLAVITALALALIVAARTPRQKIISVSLVASVAVMSAALLLTFKASGMLALLGGASVVALAARARWSRRGVMLGLGVGIGALVLAAPLADALAQRVWFLIQREAGTMFTSGRLAIWGELLGVWAQHFWFGVGLNNAGAFVSPMPSLSGGAFTFVVPSAESAYIAALVETGVLGFIALVALFTLALVRAGQRWRASQDALDLGLLAAVVALLVGNFTVAGLTTDQNGMVLGLMLGMISAESEARVGN